MHIGIQGTHGSYTEEAAQALHPTANLEHYETFSEAFAALRQSKVDSIVVALANNRIQFIPDTYEEVTKAESDIAIVAETYLRINHVLLGTSGASLGAIKEVHSQAPAIEQCRGFLEAFLPDAEIIEAHDTAGSAKHIADLNNPAVAAIASTRAGKYFGLAEIKTSIQDDPDNVTRFVELRLKDKAPTIQNANKTTMKLVTSQSAGSLAHALTTLATEGIDIAYLQSRIIPNSPFHIDFFIEINAGHKEVHTTRALEILNQQGCATTVIGSYRAGIIPIGRTGADVALK